MSQSPPRAPHAAQLQPGRSGVHQRRATPGRARYLYAVAPQRGQVTASPPGWQAHVARGRGVGAVAGALDSAGGLPE